MTACGFYLHRAQRSTAASSERSHSGNTHQLSVAGLTHGVASFLCCETTIKAHHCSISKGSNYAQPPARNYLKVGILDQGWRGWCYRPNRRQDSEFILCTVAPS